LLAVGCSFKPPAEDRPGEPDARAPVDDGAAFDASEMADASTPLDAPTPPPDAPPACVGYTNRYRVSSANADWPTAKLACEATGGHLVVLETQTENTAVRALLTSTFRFWVGMSDLTTEDTWVWLNGAAVPRNAEYWDAGQPNDNGGEDCGEMSNSGDWNDDKCSAVQPYVCECP